MQQSTLARANREAVVPDRKVQLTVRPDRQPVQVVTVKRSMHAESVKKHLPFVGVSVIINVVQFPDIRVNRRVHITPVR